MIATALAFVAVLGFAPTAAPATKPSSYWGLEPPAASPMLRSDLIRLHHEGLNVLVADPARLSVQGRAALVAAGRGAGMVVAFPRFARSSLTEFCRAERAGTTGTCAVLAGTPRGAIEAARRNVADLVVFRLLTLAQLRMLRGVHAKTHILAVARMPERKLDRRLWEQAVAIARQDPTLDLAVLVDSVRQQPLKTYLAMVASEGAGKSAPGADAPTSGSGADVLPPATPLALTARAASQTTVTLSWLVSTDNTAVTGYTVYRSGAAFGSTALTSLTVSGLTCGASYSFAVDAYDATGNRSGKVTLTASTTSCSGDTAPPTAPGPILATSSTATAIAVSWGSSSDTVGVTTYGLYRDGGMIGSSATTNSTFTGLTCGTSYTLAIDAADAAGNRSGKTSTTASTATCAGGGGTASVFLSPSGSDSSPCTQSQPCLTLQRGYEAASPGAVVQIAGGTYPDQAIDAPPKSGTADVVFAPAAGTAVTFVGITVVRGAHIEFRDLTVSTDSYNRQQAQYITWRRIKMRDFFIRGADHISYINGEVGPNDNTDVMNWITEPYQSSDPAQDILLDGMRIHDFWKHNAGAHVDCLGVDNSDRVIIRNSRFWNCEHFAIIPNTDPSGLYPRDLTIENNFIQCCGLGYYSIGIDSANGALIRFNSISGTGIGFLGGSVSGVTIDSNVIDKNNDANCGNATWRYNVVGSGNACGGILAPTGFTGPPTDLHLTAGAAAIGAGNPNSYPAADIDGQARPAGVRPDAGADER